jgi:hypothetical protein
VRGEAKLLAGLATRQSPEEGLTLPEGYVAGWRRERLRLEKRREARRQQGRFRRDPDRYLQDLEELLVQISLPS